MWCRRLRGLLHHRGARSTPPAPPAWGSVPAAWLHPLGAPPAPRLSPSVHPSRHPEAPTSLATLNAASSPAQVWASSDCQAWRCPAGLTCPAMGTMASLSSFHPPPGGRSQSLGVRSPLSGVCADSNLQGRGLSKLPRSLKLRVNVVVTALATGSPAHPLCSACHSVLGPLDRGPWGRCGPSYVGPDPWWTPPCLLCIQEALGLEPQGCVDTGPGSS